ncbi:hypothetical protein MHYP_G00004660 [Metynnis hypsauchen]
MNWCRLFLHVQSGSVLLVLCMFLQGFLSPCLDDGGLSLPTYVCVMEDQHCSEQ